jgi:hypothetical protein
MSARSCAMPSNSRTRLSALLWLGFRRVRVRRQQQTKGRSCRPDPLTRRSRGEIIGLAQSGGCSVVAQSCTLLYRRFVICGGRNLAPGLEISMTPWRSTPSRVQPGDTAEYNSAPRWLSAVQAHRRAPPRPACPRFSVRTAHATTSAGTPVRPGQFGAWLAYRKQYHHPSLVGRENEKAIFRLHSPKEPINLAPGSTLIRTTTIRPRF